MSRIAKFLLILLLLAAFVGLAIVQVFSLPNFGGTMDGARLQRMQQSPVFVGGRFENQPPNVARLALLQNLRDYWGGQTREPGVTAGC